MLKFRLPSLSFFFLTLFAFPWSSISFAQPAPGNGAVLSAVQDALQPQFVPPPPGTYQLPPIDTVIDHVLLDSTGQQVRLFALTSGKIAVVSFMYTACAEVGGCPLAAAVLQRMDRMLSERPDLRDRVRLLSVSFDPERDTPDRLAEVRAALQPQTQWRFLTGATPADIQPILTDFNQSTAKLRQADGTWSGLFRHVLKVFLLDTEHQVRNIYSLGFFNPQLVLNDIETLLMENKQARRAP
jgi:cytochrome oxidase Cu insertion factor (SCO1/SenC/PrrC family)